MCPFTPKGTNYSVTIKDALGKWPCSYCVFVALGIECPYSIGEVIGSVFVGDLDFPIANARVFYLFTSLFCFLVQVLI